MERSRLGKPLLSHNEDARPVDPAFLAPAANGTPPERKRPIAEYTQALEVSWYRVATFAIRHKKKGQTPVRF